MKKKKEKGRERARSAVFVSSGIWEHGRVLCCGDKLIDYGRELWALATTSVLSCQ